MGYDAGMKMSEVKCSVCGDGPKNGVTVYRNNEKGVDAIWRCDMHLDKEPDPSVVELVDVIERGDAPLDA